MVPSRIHVVPVVPTLTVLGITVGAQVIRYRAVIQPVSRAFLPGIRHTVDELGSLLKLNIQFRSGPAEPPLQGFSRSGWRGDRESAEEGLLPFQPDPGKFSRRAGNHPIAHRPVQT